MAKRGRRRKSTKSSPLGCLLWLLIIAGVIFFIFRPQSPTPARNRIQATQPLSLELQWSTVTNTPSDRVASTATHITPAQNLFNPTHALEIAATPIPATVQVFTNNPAPTSIHSVSTAVPAIAATSAPVAASDSCPSLSHTCEQLTCAQAYACLAAGKQSLDRDNDGVPCESICGG